jgi:hypothetical protein
MVFAVGTNTKKIVNHALGGIFSRHQASKMEIQARGKRTGCRYREVQQKYGREWRQLMVFLLLVWGIKWILQNIQVPSNIYVNC